MERKYGYIPSPKDLRDYKINKAYRNIELPKEFECHHGRIKDQGTVNSCVAHAISSVLEASDDINYSTGWIYGYRPTGYYQGEGMITSQALKTVNKAGYVENKELDVNIEVPEAADIVNKNLNVYRERASKKKIALYARLNSLEEIKQSIYVNKKPVLLAILVGNKGIELDKKYIAQIPSEYSGGHQMVCYGWNEYGLLIQNSWGDKWGNKGTFILPYEYPISEAWMIKHNSNITGSSSIVKPKFYLLRNIIMKLIKLFKKLFRMC